MKTSVVIISLLVLSQITAVSGFQNTTQVTSGTIQDSISGVPYETLYLTSSPSSVSSSIWNLSGAVQSGANSSTIVSLSTTSSTGLYQFIPGASSSSVSTILSKVSNVNAHGWISEMPLNRIVPGGKWNFSVGLSLSGIPSVGNATIESAIYAFNTTNNTGTLLAVSGKSNDIFSRGTTPSFNYSLNTSGLVFNPGDHLLVSFYLEVTQALTLSVAAVDISLVSGLYNGASSSISFPDFGILNCTVSPSNSTLKLGTNVIQISGKTVKVNLIPGSYNLSIGKPGYLTKNLSVTVLSGVTDNLNVTLKKLYSLNVSVNALFPGMQWILNISGSNRVVNGSSYDTYLVNGSYTLDFQRTIYRNSWDRYVYFGKPVNISLNGSNVHIAANYSEQYFLNVSANNPSLGTVLPGSSWQNSTNTVLINASETNSSYFSLWSGTGTGSYSGTNNPATVHVNSPINETAWFFPKSVSSYTVAFVVHGLPGNTSWGVDFNSTLESSTSDSILFMVLNGTYSYTLDHVKGYETANYSGNVTVNGTGVTVLLNFTRVTYTAQFFARGLAGASGIYWGISMNGTVKYSNTSKLALSLPNGTYNYSVLPPTGYYAVKRSGNFTVNGSTSVSYVQFNETVYTVTFTEVGLAANYTWSVELAGNATNSTKETIIFNLTDGTYNFTTSAGGYRYNGTTSQVIIQGKNVSITLRFNAILKQKPNLANAVMAFVSSFYWAIIPGIIVIVAGTYILRRKTHISDVLLVHNDGRVMRHYTQRMRPELDSDLLSATMIAIQKAIKEVTTSMKTGTLVQDGNNIALIPGELFSVVLLGSRKIEDSRIERVKQLIQEVEEENSIAIRSWDGNYGNLSFLDSYREKFMKI